MKKGRVILGPANKQAIKQTITNVREVLFHRRGTLHKNMFIKSHLKNIVNCFNDPILFTDIFRQAPPLYSYNRVMVFINDNITK